MTSLSNVKFAGEIGRQDLLTKAGLLLFSNCNRDDACRERCSHRLLIEVHRCDLPVYSTIDRAATADPCSKYWDSLFFFTLFLSPSPSLSLSYIRIHILELSYTFFVFFLFFRKRTIVHFHWPVHSFRDSLRVAKPFDIYIRFPTTH